MIDLEKKEVTGIDLRVTESHPTCVKCHPKRPGIVAIGLHSGKIYFMNMRNQDTYIFDASDLEERIKQGMDKLTTSYQEDLGISDPR